jgi:hypothetical protein
MTSSHFRQGEQLYPEPLASALQSGGISRGA